jgi:hypothetical protein
MIAGCLRRASPAGWRTYTRSPASNPSPTYREYSMIRRRMYPHRRQLSPRVRAFVDWLAPLYEAQLGKLPTLLTT